MRLRPGVSFFVWAEEIYKPCLAGDRHRRPAERQVRLDITGAQNLATLSPQDLFDRGRPKDIRATFKPLRNRHQQNWFVEQCNVLNAAFYNTDPEQEAERKRGEAPPERHDELLPKFDHNHNHSPAKSAGQSRCKPPSAGSSTRDRIEI